MNLIIECQIGLYITAILRIITDMQEQAKVIEQLLKSIKELIGDEQ